MAARWTGGKPGLAILACCAGLACAAVTTGLRAATAYVSSESGGIAVIDLDRLEVTRTLDPGGKGPRGLAISADGKYLLTANKATGDLSVIDTRDGQVLRRVPIGKNPEFVRVSGGQAFVTYEPGERTGAPGAAPDAPVQPKAGDDAPVPAEIAVIDLAQWRVTRAIPSGLETEGIEFSPDGRRLLVTNEGDDTISVYERASGRRVGLLKAPPGSRPRGIKVSPDGRRYIVTLESGNAFIVLDAGDYRILQTVPTRNGPYGVAFDRAGKRLFIAASRADTLQVFDANSYQNIADIPTGKRCWHFSFTPDDTRLLLACGRSNAVYVVDAQTYRPVRQFDGLALSWGVVTYPKSAGTLDAP
ncbi:beta-propeller fold lactonase family protein [Cupriavidus basilensis]|uniref:Beta-propeller fold lactonase family protein n=1 Tax=Cupriavidus basilensis TaxID=68895 RepID=A0ABT6AZF6_9BURK|nr:beta-propeller fold lactonase family protein [Cupriavidus basilensis]MDF3838000.1 beta-propeller fold lactonase family protein [Cupriavidus basilensis]